MSQQVHNQINAHVKQLLSGVTGIVQAMEKHIEESAKGMNAEQAKTFAEVMNNSGIKEAKEKVNKAMSDFNKHMKK